MLPNKLVRLEKRGGYRGEAELIIWLRQTAAVTVHLRLPIARDRDHTQIHKAS
jgi:hypothetical protein